MHGCAERRSFDDSGIGRMYRREWVCDDVSHGNDSRIGHPVNLRLVASRSDLAECSALGGAVLVFVFFWIIAPPFRQFPAFATVLYQASTIGIPAVAVALLMIGGGLLAVVLLVMAAKK